MNANTKTEQSALVEQLDASKVNALALITLSPEKFTAEVYQPFKDQLSSAIDSVRTVEYDITTTAGMAVAVKWRATFRDLRVAADKEKKARKAPITKIGKLLESGFDEVEERATPLEDLFDADIKAEEQRKEDLKAAKIAAERARMDAIDSKISVLAMMPVLHAQSSAEELADIITQFDGWAPDPLVYEEESERAASTVAASLVTLRDLLTARQQSEAAEAKRIADAAAEAERIAAEKVEMARQRAENERIANEQAAERQRLAAIADAQEKAAAKLREEAAANLKAEQEAQAKVAAGVKAQLEAQQAAIAEQSRKLAAQQAAADARDAAALAAAQDAKRREDDHGPALLMNAEFDAACVAAERVERERLQAMTEQAVEDSHIPTSDLEALMDSADEGVSDNEIIVLVMEVFVMDRGAAIDRLQAIDFVTAREA